MVFENKRMKLEECFNKTKTQILGIFNESNSMSNMILKCRLYLA